MWEGAEFPFPPYFSSQTSAQVSLARLWTETLLKWDFHFSTHSAGMRRKVKKSPMMLSMVTQRLTRTEPGPAFPIQNAAIPSCLPLPI